MTGMTICFGSNSVSSNARNDCRARSLYFFGTKNLKTFHIMNSLLLRWMLMSRIAIKMRNKSRNSRNMPLK